MAVRFRRQLSPEQILLLACTRSALRPKDSERVDAAIEQGVNWSDFWALARAHGIGYFAGNHLSTTRTFGRVRLLPSRYPPEKQLRQEPRPSEGLPPTEPNYLPREVKDRIHQDLWQETAHALVLRDQQVRLNAELERAGIPAIWLKGLVLAERLYGRFEARHCGDLDLLAQPSDIPRTEELLVRLGFERFRPAEAGKEFHPMAAHHSMWCRRVMPDWLLILELHHKLSGPTMCQPPAADLLERSRLVDFHGHKMRVPSLEDELMILCLHAHHHNYALLRCLMDVTEFVRRFGDQIDWKKLVLRAREYRCLGRLRAALEITDELLGREGNGATSCQLVGCSRNGQAGSLSLQKSLGRITELPSLSPRQRWAVRRIPISLFLDTQIQQDDEFQTRFSLLMDSWTDTIRFLSPRLFPSRNHVGNICPPSWRYAPVGPRVYYYLHSAGLIFRRWIPT